MTKLQQVCLARLKGSTECIGRVLNSLARYFPMMYLQGGVLRLTQRENVLLVQRLARLRADYNRLKWDTDALVGDVNGELHALQHTNTGLAREFDDLQWRVWELEQQLDDLLEYIAERDGLVPIVDKLGLDKATSGEDVVQKIPNLTHVVLGVVGGHGATQREVINELSLLYGLQRWVVVPPSRECSLNKSALKGKLERCDLIVIITGYMNHSLTHAVFGLKSAGALKGEVVLLNCRGKSGIVREVLRHCVNNFEEMS